MNKKSPSIINHCKTTLTLTIISIGLSYQLYNITRLHPGFSCITRYMQTMYKKSAAHRERNIYVKSFSKKVVGIKLVAAGYYYEL